MKPERNKPQRKTPTQTQLDRLFRELEKLIMTDKDLQAAVDALKQDVSDLQARIGSQPPALITQAQLDANTADVSAASATIKALVPPQA